jgi:hypothetical protein
LRRVSARAPAPRARSRGGTSIPRIRSRPRWTRPPRIPSTRPSTFHAGTYRPSARGQALIWFNARHDGITLEAVGDVILTAANPEVADKSAPSYPAVVNHVVYFGDGVSRKSVLRGFKITGAKSGAITVFPGSKVTVSRTTVTGNWNGVDDSGTGSTYVDSIFWNNALAGGISPGKRYELDLDEGAGVRGSFIHGVINDLRGTVRKAVNTFDPPDPRFDARFVPQALEYSKVGYRPVATAKAEGRTPR